MDWTWYLFGFKGRINRAKCWLAGLIISCWMVFLMLLLILPIGYLFGSPVNFNFSIDNLFVIFIPASFRGLSRADIAVIVLNVLFMPLFLWVFLATTVKRLHDRDRSGWWMVPFFVVPSLYGQFAEWLPDSYCDSAANADLRHPVLLGLHRAVLPEGLAEDQPVRPRSARITATARHAAALGPAERDRNGAAQGWPAAGLAC